MSINQFTELYQAKKNLELISGSGITDIDNLLDSLHKSNLEISSKYQEEIDALNARHSVMIESLDDCKETLMEVDLDNIRLTKKNKRMKKRQPLIFITGWGLGAVLIKLFVP
jgi:hypothetical protein